MSDTPSSLDALTSLRPAGAGRGEDSSGLNPPETPPRAAPGGFWRRLVAVMLDGIIVGMLQIPLSLVELVVEKFLIGSPDANSLQGISDPQELFARLASGGFFKVGATYVLFMLLRFAVTCIYVGWFYSRKGATPGKMVLDLRVVDAETGAYLSFWRAVLREVSRFLSAAIFFIGYLMVAFRSDKRALHDLIAGSRVTR